ncbi:MAG: hypothetical protein UFF97_01110, partial [Collinsella sp.]|nr:hypothetical protein [Collinsella sp.]
HALLEVEDQVFGVHAAPIIAVYGVNDMAPWGHMYVNPGLTEPYFLDIIRARSKPAAISLTAMRPLRPLP